MKNSKKSQGALEFIIITATIILFFILFFVSLNENIGDKIRDRRNILLKNIASNVRDELNMAFFSEDGYKRTFTLPQNIYGDYYNITIIDGMIYAFTLDNKSSVSFLIPNVTGQIFIGNNLLTKQKGVIYLNN